MQAKRARINQGILRKVKYGLTTGRRLRGASWHDLETVPRVSTEFCAGEPYILRYELHFFDIIYLQKNYYGDTTLFKFVAKLCFVNRS